MDQLSNQQLSKETLDLGHVVKITLAAALGGFLFGFDSSVINGANGALKVHFAMSDSQLGLAVALSLIGAAGGAYFAGRLADVFGRVRCMLAAAILFLVSAIGSGIPFGIPDFIMWRVIGGIGVGMASIIAPIYIAETAPAHLRGRLGSMQQMAIVVGIFIALLSNYLIVKIAGSANNAIIGSFKAWQLMFWVEILPAVLYGIAALRLPESPRYLISQGKIEEAKAVFAKINPDRLDEHVAAIQKSFDSEKRHHLSDLLETLTSGKKRIAPIVWVGLGLAVLQQLVGINVIFYYGSMLWQSVGFGESDAFLSSLINSTINMVMTVVAILLIDKVGRKPLLLIGSVGMALTLGTLALCFLNAAPDGSLGGGAVVALVAANFYVAFFAVTWGPVMWVMLGEMFNNRIRAVAISVCGLAQWFANFLVSWSFPILTGKSGIGIGPTYLLYTLFAAFSLFFVAKFVRETNGKHLEEM
ncbi:MAG: sugar porter family MFS transporter [Hallerella sp.]|nr:sugar porter family MFS transporter [Hallerella sp.]